MPFPAGGGLFQMVVQIRERVPGVMVRSRGGAPSKPEKTTLKGGVSGLRVAAGAAELGGPGEFRRTPVFNTLAGLCP